jgi:hypothetical protein
VGLSIDAEMTALPHCPCRLRLGLLVLLFAACWSITALLLFSG